MKDNLSLVAAATGGFMLSVALSGILRGTPVTAWHSQASVRQANVTNLQFAAKKTENSEFFSDKTPRKLRTQNFLATRHKKANMLFESDWQGSRVKSQGSRIT